MSLALLAGLSLLPAPPGSALEEVLPALRFLALVGPAWAVCARSGQDPLLAHGVLTRPRGLPGAAAVSLLLLLAFLGSAGLLAGWRGIEAGPAPWGQAGARLLHDLAFVALPEEWLFRGVLQPALERPGGPARRLLGAPLGRGALLSALLFGLAHALLELSPARLVTALPGLWFAWLRARTGSVLPGTCAHAAANAALVLALGTWPGLEVPGAR